MQQICSPYALDDAPDAAEALSRLRGLRIFYDGHLCGDNSLAAVGRQLIRALLAAGCDVTAFTSDPDWRSDPKLSETPETRARCVDERPGAGVFDLHLRNLWPPRADGMIGAIDAYLCFGWEGPHSARTLLAHLGAFCDLALTASNVAAQSLREAALAIPVFAVGVGSERLSGLERAEGGGVRRFLHVASAGQGAGLDVLIDAFGRAFTTRDRVELVIATGDRDGARIAARLARAARARPEAPPVIVVRPQASAAEIAALTRSAAALVANLRADGLDLPLTEAMTLAVPVIAPCSGGAPDFCTSQTATLIEGAPDPDSLARALRRVLDEPGEAQARAARGRELMRAHGRWADVTRRIAQAVAMAPRRAAPKGDAATRPGIDLVSTWDQVCGIATYSGHLFASPALRPHLRAVFARERGAKDPPARQVDDSGPPVTRPWGHSRAGAARLALALAEAQGEVAWIQHHPGFFTDADMALIADALARSAHRLRVLTLHNVRALLDRPAHWLSAFDLVFVHTRDDAAVLARSHHVFAVHVPHGVAPAPPADRPATPGATIIGTFGFLYPQKNVLTLIEGFALARRFATDLRLLLLTCVRDDPESLKERARVELAIEALGVGDFVETDFRFLPDEAVIERLRGCDFLCFPYGDTTESASGAARMALTADRPLLCSVSPVLADLAPYALVMPHGGHVALAEALLAMASQPALRGLRDDDRRRFVAAASYGAVAELHATYLHHHLAAAGRAARGPTPTPDGVHAHA